MNNEVNIEKFARAFADRYEVSWAHISPDSRDAWRKQVGDLLTYIDSTAFRGFLPEADSE